MFKNNRYLTKGVQAKIPLELQLFMWDCIDKLPDSADYLQVFTLEPFGVMQRITHTSENPEYKREYLFPSDFPVTAKIFVIDDGDHCTMLLSEEY